MGKVVDMEDLVCNNRHCSAEVDELYYYSQYHQLAKRDNIVEKELCKDCFDEKEKEYGVL